MACDPVQGSTFPTPVGDMRMLASDDGLLATYFPAQQEGLEARLAPGGLRSGHGNLFLLQAEAYLACYFDGDLGFAPDIPLDLRGTEFQQRVWRALAAIPAGGCTTYRELAASVGRPEAVRAVAGAVGRNPISILLPCHRVVGSDGSLTGYAGGLDVKRHLLDHERAHARMARSAA